MASSRGDYALGLFCGLSSRIFLCQRTKTHSRILFKFEGTARINFAELFLLRCLSGRKAKPMHNGVGDRPCRRCRGPEHQSAAPSKKNSLRKVSAICCCLVVPFGSRSVVRSSTVPCPSCFLRPLRHGCSIQVREETLHTTPLHGTISGTRPYGPLRRPCV